MVRVANPFLSIDARGSIGKALTAKHGRAGTPIMQKYAHPGSVHPSPASSAQVAQRKHYTDMVAAWRSLSLAEQSIWRIKARHMAMSGWNLYYRTVHPAHDVYWSDVESLLHFDGVDGSTQITDQAGAVWTNESNCVLSTTESVFGGSSLEVIGDGGIINTINQSTAWMANDWTVEMRAYPTYNNGWSTCWSANIAGIEWGSITGNGGVWMVRSAANAYSTIPFTWGEWTTVALQQKAGTWELFVNGSLATSVAPRPIVSGQTGQTIGKLATDGSGLTPWVGYIDEVRLTLGVARLVDGYTPATSEFPNQ